MDKIKIGLILLIFITTLIAVILFVNFRQTKLMEIQPSQDIQTLPSETTPTQNNTEDVTFEDDCDRLMKQISDAITQANYCNVDSDCIMLNKSIAKWCACRGRFVNKDNDVAKFEESIVEYNKICPYESWRCGIRCMALPKPEEIICKAGKCVDERFER